MNADEEVRERHPAQYLDVYDATDDGLKWVHSASVIPKGKFSKPDFWLAVESVTQLTESLVFSPPLAFR
jgi:hypothetical protein